MYHLALSYFFNEKPQWPLKTSKDLFYGLENPFRVKIIIFLELEVSPILNIF